MLDSVLRRSREIRLVVEDRLQNGARIVKGKANAEREQEWKQQHLLHPSSRMKLALRADVKDRDRDRRGKKNRDVDHKSADPARLRPAGGWMQKHA
ncbi:MAG: hypothetical protein QOE81_1246 [Verrucomicrobiota bacterium]